MAKSLYLSYDGMTDPLGQSQVLPYLFGLSKLGHQITLISFEKPEYANLKPHIANLCKENQVEWIPLSYTRKPPVISTVRDLLKLRQLTRKLVKQGDYDIVHCRSYLTALIGLHLKRQLGLKFIFDMRGFWADERVEGNIWSLKNPVFKMIYNYFKRKEQTFLTEADQVVSLTHQGKEIILSWEKKIGKVAPVTVIPCCVDTDLFDPKNFKAYSPDPNYYTLGYVGSLGTWYLVTEMLVYFKKVKEQKANARFMIITKDDPRIILDQLEELGLQAEDVLIQPATRNEVPVFLQQMDLCISFIKSSFSKQASSPTKLAEMMAMNRQIVCNTGVGDVDYYLKAYTYGESIDITTSYTPRLDFSSVPQQIEEFSLSNGIKKFDSLYTS